jgi:hypothetical protein
VDGDGIGQVEIRDVVAFVGDDPPVREKTYRQGQLLVVYLLEWCRYND